MEKFIIYNHVEVGYLQLFDEESRFRYTDFQDLAMQFDSKSFAEAYATVLYGNNFDTNRPKWTVLTRIV